MPDRGNAQATSTKPQRIAITESNRIPARFAASPLPNRRSITVRCKCHALRTYQPFQCAV